MSNMYHNEIYSFFVSNLLVKQLKELKKGMARRKCLYEILQGEKVFKVQFTIFNQKERMIIRNFLKSHRIPKSSYGIHVLLQSNSDHDGLRVPSSVLSFYKEFGGDFLVTTKLIGKGWYSGRKR